MTGPQSARPLHELLGLSAGTSVSQLRFEYERAMAEATRGGNTQRALALSRAFDALSATTRRQVYAPVGQASAPALPIPTRRGRAAPAGPSRPRNRRQRISPRHRSAARGALVFLIVVPVAILAGVAYHLHYQQGLTPRFHPARVSVPYASPSPVSVVPVPPARTLSPARGINRRARLVPLDTPVDAHGFVTILCAPRGTRPGYSQSVRPGAIVTCANGAVPHIVG